LRAHEFTDVLYRLLYESWDDDLMLDDKLNGILTRPGSWHEVNAHGEFFDVRGPLNAPPPIQKHIPNVHVGESQSSLEYGARWAQARFSPYYGIKEGKARYAEQKQRVAAAGFDPDKFLVLPGINFYLAGTNTEARAKYRDILAVEHTVEIPAAFAQAFGLDPEKLDPGARLHSALGGAGLEVSQIEAALRADPDGGAVARSLDYPQIAHDVLAIVDEDERVTLGDLFRVVQKQRRASLGNFVGDPKEFAEWAE
jgi:alkanesulfonate monooxygenase SsuD/methylene tetrahydromethanopterin reductase-like flavin-dependent oxidoreductase (luciferase family)